jgi:hypothetical protein
MNDQAIGLLAVHDQSATKEIQGDGTSYATLPTDDVREARFPMPQAAKLHPNC